jgi:hypothetical protein
VSSKKLFVTIAFAVVALALLAAGCGGGGSKKLTKDEYASQLSAACTASNDKLNALGLTDMASFKAKGDQAVTIAEDTVKQFESLTPPDELSEASKTFNASANEIVDDIKNANEAAQKDDATAFQAAGTSVQNHSKENDDAAREIGATDCVSG